MSHKIVYTVACRGSLNKESSKCFFGGGWMSDTPEKPCPHCGRKMFLIATQTEVKL